MEVVAHISVHVLREERGYHIWKTLASTVDPNGHHVVRPLDTMRLAGQHGDDGPIVVCVYEYVGPNYLSKVVDFGPAWYHLHMRGDKLSSVQDGNIVVEPVSLQTFLDFAIGAAECIKILHGQQIVHGEIRGDAFHMNTETGRIRLTNLGAGRIFAHSLTSTGWSTMSKELGAKTKLSYMSPEQTGRMSVEPDSRTDIFSLGILFWTMLLQRPAFEGDTPMDVIQAVLGQRLPSVSSIRLDVPEVINRIIQKATAKTVSERYHSVSGLRHDLVEVQRLLGTGDSAQLLHWEIATKDVSPSFHLPDLMVGRTLEHDAVVKVIDNAFRLRQASKRRNKHVVDPLSRLSEGQFSSFDTAFTAGDTSLEDDNGSSVDGGTYSFSIYDAASGDARAYKANTSKARSPADLQYNLIDGAGSDSSDLNPISLDKRLLTTLESLSAVDSMCSESEGPRSGSHGIGGLNVHRGNGSIRKNGRCEVITIAGAAGLGKSRLIQSVQIEARERGYFASSKFDQAEKTPFGPVLKLLSSLFQQVFSESNLDPVFHRTLKQHVAPAWPILHKVLSLPEFLLGPKLPIGMTSQSAKLSITSNKNVAAKVGRRDSSSSNSRTSLNNKTLDAQSSQDFLRTGSSTKALPLMNIILDILRVFTQYTFICFCLDDLHFADEESLELIAQLISTRIKMVIIVTYRPEDILSETMRGILDPSGYEGMSGVQLRIGLY